MVKRKVMAVVTCLILILGCISYVPSKAASIELTHIGEADLQMGGPKDLAVANEEKVIEMLTKEGIIPEDATYEEAQKIYKSYLQNAEKANKENTKSMTKLDRQLKAKKNQRVQKYKFKETQKDTNPKKVNILVVLMEYSDFKHNNIKPGETDMYYDNYTREHFQNMLFGDNGYEGPNGENLISLKQYYYQQSGGSLIVEGTVAGWHTATRNAAYYGREDDTNARQLVKEALQQVAKDPTINLADFDKEDIYDLDGDGNYDEPDGIIDYLMVIHAGVGEEAGGGALGSNAIWSHSWALEEGLYRIPGTNYSAYEYTIEPEDGATGVFAHEFGHNLGLPDEYDVDYSSDSSEPIGYWSIMSSGSWGGKIPGTEPPGFSPYAKELFQQMYGGNWQNSIEIDYDKLSKAGAKVTLRQADEGGQVVRINLPDRWYTINTPASGTKEYYGGKSTDGNAIKNSMTAEVDLTSADSPILTFKTWYDIERGYDFATVQVREKGTSTWSFVRGNITTTNIQQTVTVPFGITGTSKGWVDGIFDLSAFAGKKIELKFEYETDIYTFGQGFYVDDIIIKSGDTVLLSDDVEGTPKFTLNGFTVNEGKTAVKNYYLVEWRNHHGVDKGLANVNSFGAMVSYDPGMVVWYVNEFYTDNCGGYHPGGGYLSIVDADQNNIKWVFNDGETQPLYASNKFQMRDAAFSKNKESNIYVDAVDYGRTLTDTYRFTEPSFSDKTNYLNPEIPTLGVDLPKLGLTIQITNQAKDNSSASIMIKK